LTTNLYEDSNASFASDGNIYFGRYDTVIRTIWRMKADGSGGEISLSAAHSATTHEYGPKVSPDASHYAYVADPAGTGYKLYVSQPDGTGSQQQVSGSGITMEYYSPYSFSWSPDSQWLTYVGEDGTGRWIYKVKADGSSHEALTKPATVPTGSYYHSWPTWSPDGTQIGYIEYFYLYVDPTSTYIYKLRVIDPDGNVLEDALDSVNYTTPTPPPGYFDWNEIRGPITWSPDSNWLGYTKRFYDENTAPYYGYHSIHIVNTTDKSKKYTLTSGYYDYSPLWSPDGSQILFVDHNGYYPSRDDSEDFGIGTDFTTDLLLLKLSDGYLPAPPYYFSWPMFMPAIIGDTGQ